MLNKYLSLVISVLFLVLDFLIFYILPLLCPEINVYLVFLLLLNYLKLSLWLNPQYFCSEVTESKEQTQLILKCSGEIQRRDKYKVGTEEPLLSSGSNSASYFYFYFLNW